MKELGFSDGIQNLAEGNIALPEIFLPILNLDNYYPWPPFFVPICHAEHDIVSYGVVNHPTETKRTPYFAALYLERGYCVEISESEIQFVDFLAAEDVIATGDETIISAAVTNLINTLSTTKIADLRAAAEKSSILDDVLLSLDSYKNRVPAKFHNKLNTNYTGVFPSRGANNTCLYEANYYNSQNYEDHFFDRKLPWLVENISQVDLERMVSQYILDENYVEAWFSICRPGVNVQYAKKVTEKLLSKIDIRQGTAWLAAADNDNGNY
ncbi:hypothetical protein H9K75_14960 [Diaphorobacter aerolatus]|uniref:Uncharacterized protein n=1 Tax=Diaphorobacter aerolatus TaxID=1288495 RepID=A0A7H0GGX7_9BURK|nr:hypothetical protein H9K75_14960 [Diaphorobacter aerolatus]